MVASAWKVLNATPSAVRPHPLLVRRIWPAVFSFKVQIVQVVVIVIASLSVYVHEPPFHIAPADSAVQISHLPILQTVAGTILKVVFQELLQQIL